MGAPVDLKTKFDEYFHELEGFGLRSERFYESLDAFSSKEALAASMKLWLEAAFIQGARVMAQDTLDTLTDFGTATAGLEEPTRNPTECFDNCHTCLHVYFTKVLQDAEEQH